MASAPAVKTSRLRSSGMRGAFANPSNTDHLHAAAGGGDLLASARAERLQTNAERVAEGPVGETLDRPPAPDDTAAAQLLGANRAAGREGRQLPQVDDGVGHASGRAETALRQPALERHLSALVAGRTVSARARAPSLVPAARRLAVATPPPPTHPPPPPCGARPPPHPP